MATTKEQLIELIEAYAAAKATANQVLSSLSANALKNFLDGIELTSAVSSTSDDGFTVDDIPVQQAQKTRTRLTSKGET